MDLRAANLKANCCQLFLSQRTETLRHPLCELKLTRRWWSEGNLFWANALLNPQPTHENVRGLAGNWWGGVGWDESGDVCVCVFVVRPCSSNRHPTHACEPRVVIAFRKTYRRALQPNATVRILHSCASALELIGDMCVACVHVAPVDTQRKFPRHARSW